MTEVKDITSELLGNIRHLLADEIGVVEVLANVRDVINKKSRLTAKERGDITVALTSAITHLHKNVNHVPYEPNIKALESKITELTALVEQQATYIHNNIKPAEKPTEVPFLASEQPDRAFGIYSVNNEWAAHKVKGNATITEDQLKRMVESEAKLLGHKQLGHSNFHVVVVVTGGNSMRFSLRQDHAFNGLQRLFGIDPQHPQNGNVLDFGTLLGHMNHGPRRY